MSKIGKKALNTDKKFLIDMQIHRISKILSIILFIILISDYRLKCGNDL